MAKVTTMAKATTEKKTTTKAYEKKTAEKRPVAKAVTAAKKPAEKKPMEKAAKKTAEKKPLEKATAKRTADKNPVAKKPVAKATVVKAKKTNIDREFIKNYCKTDIIATGIIRPKTTSLFFDKIWIPESMKYTTIGSLLGYDNIPAEVCLLEALEIPDYYPYILANYYNGWTVEDSMIKDELGIFRFRSYEHRNIGIIKIVTAFKKYYDIDIVPIFLNENHLKESFIIKEYAVIKKLNKEFRSSSKIIMDDKIDRNKTEAVHKEYYQNYSVLQICINMIPEIVEDKLDWKQVLEIRKDKNSIKSLHRFRNWVNLDLLGKSEFEIKNIIEKAFNEYEFALKKHGIITATGGFSTILSGSSIFFDAFQKGELNLINIGLPITAGLITFTVNQIINLLEVQQNPIAYYYDISKK